MGRLAVVGKVETLGEPPAERRVRSRLPLAVFDHGSHVTLYRHGTEAYVAPHRVDHAPHLQTLAQLGCDRLLALSSVGSLHPDLPVGTFVVPDDFIALAETPVVASEPHQHVVPGFTAPWRDRLLAAWHDVADEPLVDHGVYWQMNGPRFETRAEIRLAATAADVIGMTMASECVAANQLGLAYAGVCIVDNLANGVAGVELTLEEFRRAAAANAVRLLAVLARLVPVLAE